MANKVDWDKAIQPLLKKYRGKKHPLEYKNLYQLLVMVVLSAQDSDKNINQVAPRFFQEFPNMKALGNATEKQIHEQVVHVRNFGQKTKRLMGIAEQLKDDQNIPITMQELLALPGIGRKSANVIMREAEVKAEGVIVDLHVVRVAERLGITKSDKPEVIEADLMKKVDEKDWGAIGMAISFLGRETCRPTDPNHEECVMKEVCVFYNKVGKRKNITKGKMKK